MKIAAYKAYGAENASLYEATDWREGSSDYIRMTEIVEVDIPPLPPEATVPLELAVIDAEEKHLLAKHLTALNELNTRRANLLALTHQVAT